jgi:antirestriction protein ArdC
MLTLIIKGEYMKNAKPNMMKEMQANIIELMKTEGDNWTKSWVEVGLPMNIKTKKHYKGGNVFNLNFMVIKNGWKCNQWATFKQWSDMGYKIKKGSKGSQVYYWELREKKVSWLTEAEKAKYHATKKLPTYLLQRFAFVFNGVQIEDYKFEKIALHKTKLNEKDVAVISDFISNTQAHFVHGSQDGAYYERLFDTIHMPDKKDFFTDVDYFSTKLHELTHWTMTEKRANRVAEKLDYATEELVAEIGSAFMCAYLGISKTPRADHAKYLNAWIQKIEESEKAMTKAFSLAQKAMECLIALQEKKAEVA